MEASHNEVAARLLAWGALPPNPWDLPLFLARMDVFRFRRGTGTITCPPAFPAAEPVARVASLRGPIPSGSGRPSINHAVRRLNEKASNGDYPLNFVSHLWGSPPTLPAFPTATLLFWLAHALRLFWKPANSLRLASCIELAACVSVCARACRSNSWMVTSGFRCRATSGQLAQDLPRRGIPAVHRFFPSPWHRSHSRARRTADGSSNTD